MLYFGILIDIIVPIAWKEVFRKGSYKYSPLVREIWSIFHYSLWEALVSTLVVIQPKQGNWDSISFAIISFILIISMWWQYFDNMEKKLDKSRQTSGQIIIYGHLFILMSLSMVAASIRLLFLHEVYYSFILYFVLVLYCSISCQLQLFSSIQV